jgi:F-box and WD-40 domain protein 1/11
MAGRSSPVKNFLLSNTSPRSSGNGELDEGFSESRPDLIPPQIMLFTPEQKADLIMQLGYSLKPQLLSRIIDKFITLIRFDVVSALPFELAVLVFDHLTPADCCNAALVSKKWRITASNDYTWKKMFNRNGWQADSTKVVQMMQFMDTATPESLTAAGLLRSPLPSGLANAPFFLYKYLFQQKMLLRRNWFNSNYKKYYLEGHKEGIYCVQFDKNTIVSGSRDDTVGVWDLQGKKLVRQLAGHSGSVLCVQYDDKYVISGSSDATIMVWDKHTGNLLKQLKGHGDSVLNLRFKGNVLLSGSKDRSIKIWNIKEGICEATLVGHKAAVNVVMFSHELIVSASGDRAIRVWDFKTKRCLHELTDHGRGIACIHFDGQTIVSGSSDKSIKIWSAKSGALLRTITGHTDLVRTVQFDSERIVSGSYDKSIKMWNMKTGQLIWSIDDLHESRIFKLQYTDDMLVSCSQDRKLCVLDFSEGVDTRFF